MAFVSEPLAYEGATTAVTPRLDVCSDHMPLLTYIPWDQRYDNRAKKLRPETLEKESFLKLLRIKLQTGTGMPLEPTTEILDKVAQEITQALQEAY